MQSDPMPEPAATTGSDTSLSATIDEQKQLEVVTSGSRARWVDVASCNPPENMTLAPLIRLKDDKRRETN